ncbi:hypothetical protein HHI36_022609 [Cryptolaemus montrouzieri]|uniref:Uncharacterized protein n=1 Tax=Cryptolaemus montrouzieri TaxID=559131 RepID=A0ABD2N1D7_9CUCU
MQGIISKNLRIGCPNYLTSFFNTTPTIAKYLESHHVACDHTNNCLHEAILRRDMVVCKPKIRLRSEEILIDQNTGRWMIKVLNQPLYVRYSVAFFQKGHPFLPLFDRYLYRLQDSGIMENILTSYELQRLEEPLKAEIESLRFEHILAPVVVWFIGIIMSLVMFTVERVHFASLK